MNETSQTTLADPSAQTPKAVEPVRLDDVILTRREVAPLLRMSVRSFDRLVALRKGPPRLGLNGKPLYRLSSIKKWLESIEAKPTRECRRARRVQS